MGFVGRDGGRRNESRRPVRLTERRPLSGPTVWLGRARVRKGFAAGTAIEGTKWANPRAAARTFDAPVGPPCACGTRPPPCTPAARLASAAAPTWPQVIPSPPLTQRTLRGRPAKTRATTACIPSTPTGWRSVASAPPGGTRLNEADTLGLYTTRMMAAARALYARLGFVDDEPLVPRNGQPCRRCRLDLVPAPTG